MQYPLVSIIIVELVSNADLNNDVVMLKKSIPNSPLMQLTIISYSLILQM